MRNLWNGQVPGSGIAAGICLLVLPGAGVWVEVVGLSRPATLTGFLIWTYALMAAVVVAALLAGTAVRIIFLRLTSAPWPVRSEAQRRRRAGSSQ